MASARPDVAIVGAGIVGLATAYFLGRRGVSTVVVERDSVGSHASGFAYAALGTFDEAGMDGRHFDVASEGMRLHRHLAEALPERTGINVEFRQRPQLVLSFTEEEAHSAREPSEWGATLRSWEIEKEGLSVRWIDAKEARSIEPRITHEALGGLYTEGTCDVNPYRLTLAMAMAAETQGTEIRHGVVTGIERNGDRASAVVLEGDRIECDQVVVATGPWSGQASSWLGHPVPMQPWKGQILRLRLPGPPIVCSVAGGDHFTSTKPDGLVWVGPTFEDAGLDEGTTTEGRDEIMAGVLKNIPSLAEGQLVLHTACIRPLSADRKLILGRVPGWEGVYLATGGGRLGMMLGPAMGKLTADLIATGTTDIPLDEFDPGRFADGTG